MSCLDSFVSAEINGSNHIYHWRNGDDEAVCEISRSGNLGWFLDSALGPQNAELREEVPNVPCPLECFAAALRRSRPPGLRDSRLEPVRQAQIIASEGEALGLADRGHHSCRRPGG